MKNARIMRRFAVWAMCFIMSVSLLSVVAIADSSCYGIGACSCGGTAVWTSPGVTGTQYTHIVNGRECTYTHWSGYQGLVCTSCGSLLEERPVSYDTGHNH